MAFVHACVSDVIFFFVSLYERGIVSVRLTEEGVVSVLVKVAQFQCLSQC